MSVVLSQSSDVVAKVPFCLVTDFFWGRFFLLFGDFIGFLRRFTCIDEFDALFQKSGTCGNSSKHNTRRIGALWQHDVLELLTAAEATMFRRGTGIALYIGPDRFDLQFATNELAQDMQTPSKLSVLRLRRFVRYLLGAADVGPFFAYPDEPNTVLVWTGGVQLGSHTIETWNVNQQVVLLSSAESESTWPQPERVQKLLSRPEEEIYSARQDWSVRRCGSGSRDRRENLLEGKGRAL